MKKITKLTLIPLAFGSCFLCQVSQAEPTFQGTLVAVDEPLYAVTHAANRFVAVGHGGTIMTSADGLAWTKQVSGTPCSLHSLAYGHGLFVTVGNEGVILTSKDGAGWISRPSQTDERLRGVAYGNGTFVAVGYDGLILTSPDGVNWTQRHSGVRDRLQGVAYGEGLFVAVGWHGSILTSREGVHWGKTSHVTGDFNHVSCRNGRFTAADTTGVRLASTNGKNWAPCGAETESRFIVAE